MRFVCLRLRFTSNISKEHRCKRKQFRSRFLWHTTYLMQVKEIDNFLPIQFSILSEQPLYCQLIIKECTVFRHSLKSDLYITFWRNELFFRFLAWIWFIRDFGLGDTLQVDQHHPLRFSYFKNCFNLSWSSQHLAHKNTDPWLIFYHFYQRQIGTNNILVCFTVICKMLFWCNINKSLFCSMFIIKNTN